MLNTIENTESHNPFYIRRSIVRASLAIAFVTFILLGLSFWVIASYMFSVAVIDQLLFYVWHMKSSDYAEAERLLVENEATLEHLDKYSDGRRHIRLASLLFGVLAAMVALIFMPTFFLPAFCLGYVLTTAAGIYYAKLDIKNKYPPAFVRDDSYYVPRGGTRPGFISPAQAGLAASGRWPWGPVDIS